jgi:CRP-like cAMP-binding protein
VGLPRVQPKFRNEPWEDARFAEASTKWGNTLLADLPPAAIAVLEPHLETVQLQRGQILFRAREPLTVVHFPETAVVSLISTLTSGESLAVGLVGRYGLTGTAVLPGITTMPCEGIVQIAGVAHRLDAEVLRRELLRNEALHAMVCRFAYLMLVRSMQLSICNAFHPAEQRCIRWLLMVHDLVDGEVIPLTHDMMATMLGLHRPTVTLALRTLARCGLIDERRGRILIKDRARLEEACCECYGTLRHEQRRLSR